MPKHKAEQEGAGEEMVSLDEAGGILGVSRSTLQRMLRQGNVRGFKVGRQWRFRRSDLDKFGRIAHPSATGVKVTDIERLVATLVEQEKLTGEAQFEPGPAAFPATEEEVAVDNLFKTMLAAAARANASDIHLDPTRHDTSVRFRVDGVLHQTMKLPRYAHKPMIVAIKQRAGLALDQEQVAQDGRFRFVLDGDECDARVATLPSIHGESVVMRLLPQVAQLLTLDSPNLGMSAADLERFKRLLRQPCGMILAAGPSGCGKTSLLYAALQQIASPEIKTMTIEDPVEFAFPWVTQAHVNVKAGFSYEQAMRAVFRHDPDVIMIGDIRSLYMAEMATRYAMTGHLVMSIIHAGSAVGVICHLLDMGVEPFVLAESLICVVSMRLARKVCEQCSAPDQPSYATLAALVERARSGGYQLPESPRFMRGAGCDACRRTGYYGRTAIFEVMEIMPEVQRLIVARAPIQQLRDAALRGGMTTLAADALGKVAKGITTVVEAARVLPQEDG